MPHIHKNLFINKNGSILIQEWKLLSLWNGFMKEVNYGQMLEELMELMEIGILFAL